MDSAGAGATGRFHSTESGQVLFTNRGINGSGYALCLECGRAGDMPHAGALPTIFQKPHKRLRGGKVDNSADCSGSHDSWKITQGIDLVHRDSTDVFELQLKHPETQAFLDDATVATTLAVALRHAAALVLGINDEELGYAVNHVEVSGDRTWSILLYDTADGGAGYASSIGRHILPVTQAMFEGLDCPGGCDKACHHCLMTSDTQYQAQLLDRQLARQWLTEAFPSRLQLPDRLRLLGPASRLEAQPLFQALDRALQQTAAKRVRLFFGGDAANWDTAFGELRQRIASWAGRALAVDLLIYQSTFNALDDDMKGLLVSLAQGLDLALATVADDQRPLDGAMLAEVEAAAITRWACQDPSVGEVGDSWGRPVDQPIIVAYGLEEPIPATWVTLADYTPSDSEGDADIDIHDELHGPAATFGERFWNHVLEQHDGLERLFESDQLSAIQYSDRYLKNPLGVVLLLQVLYALDQRYPNCYARALTRVKVEQNHREHRSNQRMIWDDWSDDSERDKAVQHAFEYVDLCVQVGTYSRQHMPHFRALELMFASGKTARLRLDEGWGYWEAEQGYNSRFDFNASPADQGQAIAEWCGKLLRQRKKHPTALVLSLR